MDPGFSWKCLLGRFGPPHSRGDGSDSRGESASQDAGPVLSPAPGAALTKEGNAFCRRVPSSFTRGCPAWSARNMREATPASSIKQLPQTETCHTESRFFMSFSKSRPQFCQNRGQRQRFRERSGKKRGAKGLGPGQEHTRGAGSENGRAVLPCREHLGNLTPRKHLSPPPSLTEHPSLRGPSWRKEQALTKPSHGRWVSLPQAPTAPSPQVSRRCDLEPRLAHPVGEFQCWPNTLGRSWLTAELATQQGGGHPSREPGEW